MTAHNIALEHEHEHKSEVCASPLFRLHNASISRQDKKLLDNIDLQVGGGESVALIGPNGAGKSTLLKVLAGEIPVERGNYVFNNRHYRNWTPRELSERRAVLPQQLTMQFPLRVSEVVAMGLPKRERGNLKHPLIRQLLAQFDVECLMHRRVNTLSGGEQQRVQLARVVAQIIESSAPPLLLLDECTSALDPAHQHRVLHYLKTLAAKGAGVLWTAHDLNLAARYADRIVILQNGRIVADGSPRATMTPEVLYEIYGIHVEIIHVSGVMHVLQRGID